MKRRNNKEWLALYYEWRKSGEDQTLFCTRMSIPINTFRLRTWQARKEFTAEHVPSLEPPEKREHPLEMPCGRTVCLSLNQALWIQGRGIEILSEIARNAQ